MWSPQTGPQTNICPSWSTSVLMSSAVFQFSLRYHLHHREKKHIQYVLVKSQRKSSFIQRISNVFSIKLLQRHICILRIAYTVQFKALGSPVSLSIHTIRGSPAQTDWSVPVHSGSSPLQPSTINTPRGRLQSPFLWFESDGDPNHTQPW